MELTGRIIAVQDAKSGTSSKTGNPWMKQEYVIEMPGQYPRHCVFTVFGEDRIKQLNIQNGEDLTVQFDIDAREYNGRWYNDFYPFTSLANRFCLVISFIFRTFAPTNFISDGRTPIIQM